MQGVGIRGYNGYCQRDHDFLRDCGEGWHQASPTPSTHPTRRPGEASPASRETHVTVATAITAEVDAGADGGRAKGREARFSRDDTRESWRNCNGSACASRRMWATS